jgi:hypothetical protein
MGGNGPLSMRSIQFLSIILIALALIPGGAHLLALPNKVGLTKETYFTVQNIYFGWALLGIITVAALIVNLLLAYMLRDQRLPALLALAAAICIGLTLVIFFIWTQPANAVTANWTQIPDNWRSLRANWEYSHAVNAAITFVALCASVLSALFAQVR